LSHLVSLLNPGQTVTIVVTAIGNLGCQTSDTTLSGTTKVCVVLPAPIFEPSTATINSITFRWIAVPTAVGYEVSRNPAGPWVAPSSGSTGLTHTISNLAPQENVTLYVRALSPAPCQPGTVGDTTSTASPCTVVPMPVVTLIDSTVSTLTFKWDPIAAATGYRVSINNGPFVTPSSGANGTMHVVTNLTSTQAINIRVLALGLPLCPTSDTTRTFARAPLDQVYIPNTFLPNSSVAVNRSLRVFSNILKEARFMIFNQWGQKVYEANTVSEIRNNGWNGTYQGKPQPVGVYIYVGRFTLNDGSVIDKKGSINLVR
jgi:hypothetical protein